MTLLALEPLCGQFKQETLKGAQPCAWAESGGSHGPGLAPRPCAAEGRDKRCTKQSRPCAMAGDQMKRKLHPTGRSQWFGGMRCTIKKGSEERINFQMTFEQRWDNCTAIIPGSLSFLLLSPVWFPFDLHSCLIEMAFAIS